METVNTRVESYKAIELFRTIRAHHVSPTELRLTSIISLYLQTDPQYNFFACIKASLAREVGCRPFWDKLSPADIPACTTMEELNKHQLKDQEIWMRHEQKIILNMTGCKVPCTYKVGE